tara:strand:+ start:540 stop:860 length:321 start_codon:yes stop_codon:yes gene_type:complete
MNGFLYCTATNTGKGFITHQDRHDFYIRGFIANVWVVEKNTEGANWIARVSGVAKTHAEAKTIVDNQITTDQGTWDGDNVDGETADEKVFRLGARPTAITLPYIPE